MPAEYNLVGTVPTVELLGASQTQAVQQATFQAIPSGVNFTLIIAQVDWTPERLKLIVPVVAEAINKAADVKGVADINVYQDVNNAGQFVTKMDVEVTSDSGRSSAIIHPPYGSIFDARFAAAVGKEVANLNAIEAGE